MIRLAAPAKINLSLDVLDRRADGFHNLRSIFVALDWADELALSASANSHDRHTVQGGFAADIPVDETNLVRRAWAELRKKAHVPAIDAVLTKSIPSGAGLGGGSSDAVAAMRGAAKLFHLVLAESDFLAAAAAVGSDCPFFVRGGAQFVEGRGEVLRPLGKIRPFAALVVVPPANVPTADAFRALEPSDKGPRTDWAALEAWLRGDRGTALPRLQNAFERAIRARVPAVQDALAALETLAPGRTVLSGSGSACFAIFDTAAAAREALARWPLHGMTVRVCQPVAGT